MNNKVLIALAVVIVAVIVGSIFAFRTPASAPIIDDVTATTTAAEETPNTVAGTNTEAKTFTMAEVATHNSKASCYTAVRGSVYDVTTWIDMHPGGAQRILSLCGKDGTAAFTGQHGGQENPEAALASFKLGVLAK